MNNLLKIMSLTEEDMHRVVLVNGRNEGGINYLFDPQLDQMKYQVFIHKSFPLITESSWQFDSFSEARRFASTLFKTGWELLAWDQKVNRPCADGGQECGSGSCEMCKSTGGGCTSCGASDEAFAGH